MKKFSFVTPILKPLQRNNYNQFQNYPKFRESVKSLADPVIPNRHTGKLEKLSKIMSLDDKTQSQFINNKGPVYAVYHKDKLTPNKIYNNWAECSAYTNGRKNINFKKFQTQQEANVWLDSREHVPVPDGAEVVYTDGACPNNQNSKIARAGIGVYFGDRDPRNVSEPLEGEKQTNQRAELKAAIKAIEMQCTHGKGQQQPLMIVTDSKYVADSATDYLNHWAKNGYRLKDGTPLANIDLWMDMKKLIDSRKAYPVVFKWVKGHDDNSTTDDAKGNAQADKLAVEGANKKRKAVTTSTTTTTTSHLSTSTTMSTNPISKTTTTSTKKFPVTVDLTRVEGEELDEYEKLLIEKLNEHRAKKKQRTTGPTIMNITKVKSEFIDD